MSKHKAWRKPKEKCQPQLSASNFECVDCGQDTSLAASREYYMVKLPIWLQAGMIYDGGMLCIGCLETRIGRQLTRSDFDMDLPINTLQEGPFSTRSDRLKNRLKSMHTNYSLFMPNSSISSDYDVLRKRIKSKYPKILAYLAK